MLNLLAWIEINRQRLIGGFVAVLVVFGGVYLWRHFASEREERANAALLALRPRSGPNGEPINPPQPADYLKVAEDYASSPVGSRARLLAATAYFEAGKFAEAQSEFERVLAKEGTGVLAAQGAYGVAASLDAQGKTDAAATKYQEVAAQFPEDAVAAQARLALASLKESAKQPDAALRIYDELLRDRQLGPLAQTAGQRREQLLRQHPQLASTNAAPAAVGTPAK